MGTEQCAVVVSLLKLKLWLMSIQSRTMSIKFLVTECYLWIGTQRVLANRHPVCVFWHPVVGLSPGGVGQLGMAHPSDGPASSLRMFGHVHRAMCGGGVCVCVCGGGAGLLARHSTIKEMGPPHRLDV